jgi:glycosyltransferase involved in cell wall biosynthesis
MDRVTVLLSVYNGRPFLRDVIESLKRQSHPEFTAYVIDNASDDGSADVIAHCVDRRFTVTLERENLGIPRNWSRAIDRVDTPYFVLAHQDDVYEPDFLGATLAVIARFPRALIAHTRVEAIDEGGTPFFVAAERYKDGFWPGADPYERGPDDGLKVLANGNYVVMPTAMYRTSAVRTVGHFAPEYRFVADWQFWLRGLLAGFSIAGTHRKLVRRRWHRDMGTRKAEADFTRYDEEVALLRWIAEACHERGLRSTPAADYSTVMNLVLHDFATRLAAGHVSEARHVLTHATRQIPGFRGSARERLGWTALRLGRPGGACLRVAGATWVRAVASRATLIRSLKAGYARREDRLRA